MTAPAERMRMMRERRRGQGLRELRLVVPDPRLGSVRKRVAAQVVRLDRGHEDEALSWIEAVSEFDAPSPSER
ncbi:antitoxin MazE-like protein [Roseiarcus sp.]|uniref:antitoxin MazE-like protein n=1 Tax=Roseiarcus sp. TaxID=1969460 RepID=UPI003F995F61